MVVTPHIYLLLLIMLCLLMLDKLHSELTDKGINYEVVALINLKAEISDPHNELANWDGNEVDPCNWSFVICSASRFVTKLVLSKSQLSGFLSPSIANLTLLESLMLKDNNFSGLIPEEIGKLSKLNNLDLSNNHFIGPIPRTLDGLKNLRTLRLNNNSLTGPIPPSIVNLPLDIVELSFNNLSGSIPNISNTKLNIVGNPLLCGPDATTSCSANAMLPVSSRISSTSPQGSGSSSLRAIIIGVVVGAFFTSLLVSLIILLLRRRRQKQDDAYEMQDPEFCYGQIRKFTYRELQTATDNFNTKNILGKGGFAYVYKGTLSDGTIVAVKRLNDKNTVRGEVQFQTEVKMISLAVHRHLLRLLGYCVNGSERILVYPFMPNGSVASRLRETPALDWATRRKIALGSGRGLMYLHEQCDPKIIHRDVKAANILLDKDFEAVVGDFGLAKLLDHKDSHVTTAVLGTVGHIAPEYLTSGQSSEKTDVFGFGIFLLELITGQRAIDFGRRKGQQGNVLLDWKCLGCYDPQVKTLQQEARLLELVDPAIKDCYNPAELEAIAQVTLLCTQFIPSDRPRMAEVIRMLEGDGLSERWEAWQRGESDRLRDSNDPRLQTYYDLAEDDSVALSGVQLSGPR